MLLKILVILFANSVISAIMYNGNYFYPKMENYRRTQEKIWIPKSEQRPKPTSNPVTFYRNNRRIMIHNGLEKEVFPSRMPSLYSNGHFGKKLFTPHTGILKYPGLPLFEADEDESPVIIYHGPQADIIYKNLGNTMPYPMEEPVPGQLLHPPIVPRFKAVPLPIYGTTSTTTTPAPYYYHRNNYYTNQKQDSFHNIHNVHNVHNVTMIPFYEHEAIPDPRSNLEDFLKITPRPTSPYKQNSLASIVYGIPYHQYVKNYPTYISPDHKKYASYTKQEDVNIKPIYEHIQEDVYPTVSPENIETGTHFTPNRQINAPYNNFVAEATSPMPRTVSSTSINRTVGDETFRIVYDIPMADDPHLNINEEVNTTFTKAFTPKKSVLSAKYGGFKVSSSYKASPGKYYKYKKLKAEKKPLYDNFINYQENDVNSDHNEHSYYFTSDGLPDVVLEKPKAESRRDYKDWILYEARK
ncbi:hypothetical protein ACFFRR_008980 [Megaselia abdita]